jgi:hypothetical protein
VRPLQNVRESVGRALLASIAATQAHAPGWGSKHRATLFLANGAAFGLDPPRAVPELSTPECLDPFDLAAAHRAGLTLVSEAAASVGEAHRHRLTPTIASTFHQPGEISLGTHENYGVPTTLEPSKLFRALITWIVIRQILTEPGVVSPAPGSSGFALSPRADLMTRVSGPYTTHDRAVFTTCRLNYAGRGWRRVHVISAGGTASSWAIVVRHGVTALLLELFLRGEPWPDELILRHPLRALRTVSLMPDAPIATVDGSETTPLGLNERLLTRVGASSAKEPLAPWADRVLAEWERGLAAIARGDNEETSLLLESALRRRVLTALLDEASVDWRSARVWAECLNQIRQMSPEPTAPLPRNSSGIERRLGVEAASLIEGKLKLAGFSWRDYPRFARVIDRLYSLDVELARVPDGLGVRLDDARPDPERVVPSEHWRRFMRRPPKGTRAEARGRLIDRHGTAPDLRASWAGVVAWGRVYDLPSPLSSTDPPPRG